LFLHGLLQIYKRIFITTCVCEKEKKEVDLNSDISKMKVDRRSIEWQQKKNGDIDFTISY